MKKSVIIIIIIIIILLILLLVNISNITTKSNQICLIYNYYERDDLYKENFIYFLENGIYEEVDYYIVINGNCTVKIPKRKNVFVYYRKNVGYDFGAYSYAVNNKLIKNYDYYFFMNTSVRGPYLRDTNEKWYDHFIPLFNANVHLVGTSISICTSNAYCVYDDNYKRKTNPHIQTMFFGMDQQYFIELKNDHFFDEDEIIKMDFTDLIKMKEVGLSQKAIEKGYNINCILSKYRDLDYLTLDHDINETSLDGDPYFSDAYFGETIDPYEVIFFKTNRI
uniref:Uncharacterized protein n=1 Tax=viral metagenome TaxID=1070528 RepID=A0A6C0DP71_9ZZZZ